MFRSLVVVEVSKTWENKQISEGKHNEEQEGDIVPPDAQLEKIFILSS